MDEMRVNAAMAELNNLIQSLMQRNINLAGDLAVALAEVETLKQPQPPWNPDGTTDVSSLAHPL